MTTTISIRLQTIKNDDRCTDVEGGVSARKTGQQLLTVATAFGTFYTTTIL